MTTPTTEAGRALDRALASAAKRLPVGYADKYRAVILDIEREAVAAFLASKGDKTGAK